MEDGRWKMEDGRWKMEDVLVDDETLSPNTQYLIPIL